MRQCLDYVWLAKVCILTCAMKVGWSVLEVLILCKKLREVVDNRHI
jgi:hypothetical protein